MGYYSTLGWEIVEDPIKVNTEKKRELENFFSSCENDENISGFEGVKVEIDENGKFIGIGLNEYHAKFYDDLLFADKLSKVIETGKVRLFFTGEDGETWGYEVSPGRVEPLVIVALTQSEFEKVRKCLGGS